MSLQTYVYAGAFALVFAACRDGAVVATDVPARDATVPDASPETDADTHVNDADLSTDATACTTLFGRPNDRTGLTSDQCRPVCACNGTVFAPPAYTDAFIRSLVTDWRLATPFAPVAVDPYSLPVPVPGAPDTVCAVLPSGDAGVSPREYTLVTYPNEADARAHGASVTHFGACGVCSTLANLAVYMRENDLTAPVRACGLQGLGTSIDAGDTDAGATAATNANVACLEALGFDEPCAQAWYYDTVHTRTACLATCLAQLSRPYQLPDGALNPCIACDETASGPVFKAVAGRTRRNSGLPNALCRPCSEVRPLVHAY